MSISAGQRLIAWLTAMTARLIAVAPTAYLSQIGILTRCRRDRLAAGGADERPSHGLLGQYTHARHLRPLAHTSVDRTRPCGFLSLNVTSTRSCSSGAAHQLWQFQGNVTHLQQTPNEYPPTSPPALRAPRSDALPILDSVVTVFRLLLLTSVVMLFVFMIPRDRDPCKDPGPVARFNCGASP